MVALCGIWVRWMPNIKWNGSSTCDTAVNWFRVCKCVSNTINNKEFFFCGVRSSVLLAFPQIGTDYAFQAELKRVVIYAAHLPVLISVLLCVGNQLHRQYRKRSTWQPEWFHCQNVLYTFRWVCVLNDETRRLHGVRLTNLKVDIHDGTKIYLNRSHIKMKCLKPDNWFL